jgi:hypothetical protein
VVCEIIYEYLLIHAKRNWSEIKSGILSIHFYELGALYPLEVRAEVKKVKSVQVQLWPNGMHIREQDCQEDERAVMPNSNAEVSEIHFYAI